MKPLPEYEDLDIKLNASGEIDVEYYIAHAHQLREEELGEMYGEAKAWIKSKVAALYERYLCMTCQHSH
jgi:hypothetical protein